jgi:hypothetical protein
MMALDRGAIEANYAVGKYSDVLLTPDLRILISGPGQADLSIRVNTQGDTCVDNHGADAPYVTVSSQLEGGAYRVLPDQRVNFQHGSLREVVDHEPEPCGCPAVPVTSWPVREPATANPAAARTAGRWPFLHACGYGFPHCGKRGTGGASRSIRSAGGSTGETHAPGDRSAHLQRRESGCARSCSAPLLPPRPSAGSSGHARAPCTRPAVAPASQPEVASAGPPAQSKPLAKAASSIASATSFPKSSAK